MKPNKPLELSAQELAAIAGGNSTLREGEKPPGGLYGTGGIEKQINDKLPELTQKIDELLEPKFYTSDAPVE
ncbi:MULTISPECIES: hypothetical protein [unclassified Phormidesmis]